MAFIIAILLFFITLLSFGLAWSMLIIAIAIVGLLSASMWNLYRKKWVKGLLNLCILSVSVFMITIVFVISNISKPISFSSNGEDFAEKLKIPQNMPVAEPKTAPDNLDSRAEDLSEQVRKGQSSFQLYKLSQPGKYYAEIWINPGQPGLIYLKAYEVTQKIPLSVKSLKEKSKQYVDWSDNPNEIFYSGTRFTIYEGDWGDPYAASFQVWFKPNDKNRTRKLMEKTYKIEGWQR